MSDEQGAETTRSNAGPYVHYFKGPAVPQMGRFRLRSREGRIPVVLLGAPTRVMAASEAGS